MKAEVLENHAFHEQRPVSLSELNIAKHMELGLRSSEEQAMKGAIDMPSYPEVILANFPILFIIHAFLFTDNNDLPLVSSSKYNFIHMYLEFDFSLVMR